MKRIICTLTVALMVIMCFAGCQDAMSMDNKKPTATEATTENVEATPDTATKTYENSYKGLVEYFEDKAYITIAEKDSNVTKMDATLIGAKEGNRYRMSYNKAEILIELYYYENTDNDFVKSVKENGTFQIGELEPVTAYIADGGKYLMVYTDRSNPAADSDNGKRQAEVIEAFKAFPNTK